MEAAEINQTQGLIESAIPTLRRDGPPVILHPEIFVATRGFDFYSQDEDLIKEKADRITTFASQGRVKAYGVTAKEVLTQALEIPKIVPSGYDKYFTYTDELGRMMEDLIIEQRLGRKSQKGKYDFYAPASQIHHRAESWRREVCGQKNTLWELGVIVENEQGIHAISLSYPWDGSRQTFYERLTPPPPIFVGREKELDMFSQFITGKSHKEAQLASAFSADNLKIWWDQAKLSNKIIRGSWKETEMKMRPRFEDRMRSILESRISNKEFHEAVRNATKIYGYSVTARKSDFPGATDLELHLDENNWIEEIKPRKASKKELVEGSFEYMEKNKPEEWKMWILGGGGILYNDKHYDDPNQDFSVYIQIKRDDKGNDIGVDSLQVSQHLKLNEDNQKKKRFYINNSEFGDGFTFSDFVRKEEVKPLERKDYQKVLDLFLAARKRGEVDSSTYWHQKKKVGLTKETVKVLDEVEKILKDKLENSL